MIQLSKGKKVTYNPDYDKKETGIVKSFSGEDHVFVVYSCGGNWHKYENYTGARTKISDLEEGWDAEVETTYSDEYLEHLKEKQL